MSEDYGEPLVLTGMTTMASSRPSSLMTETVWARAVACVNALAGRDPSKLAELEEAAEQVIVDCLSINSRLAIALAAFRVEETQARDRAAGDGREEKA